jgi:GT2 family glycosyltransferase
VQDWARVLVVDDGSTDGTRSLIGEQFPWVVMLHGNGDLWWAGAIHQGMRHAIRSGADCVCWLNDDCWPDRGTLELLATTAVERGAVCGALCRDVNGGSIAYGGGLMIKGWPAQHKDPLPPIDEIPVHWLHGNLVAIPALVWQRIGLPECQWMRHHMADIFYTYRAHEHGIPVLLMKRATAASHINDGLSYRSWADPEVSPTQLLSGLWNLRVWWYAPGLAYFLIALHGWRGLILLLQLAAKLVTLSVFKALLPRRWMSQLRASRLQRTPAHLAQASLPEGGASAQAPSKSPL